MKLTDEQAKDLEYLLSLDPIAYDNYSSAYCVFCENSLEWKGEKHKEDCPFMRLKESMIDN